MNETTGDRVVQWTLRDTGLPADARYHLALDAALLEQLDQHPAGVESLRLWDVDRVTVVVGRASRCREEVDLDACRRDGVPIVRRGSGGAAVVVGPGCLLYSVVLSVTRRPALHQIDQAHRTVLARHAAALDRLVPGVCWEGTSDLAWRGRKFSGNSLRCRARAVLYHGTILYDFPLELVTRYLPLPPRRPMYRADRPHEQFLVNYPASREALSGALAAAWNASPRELTLPESRMAEWMRTRFGYSGWHCEGRERSGGSRSPLD